MAAEQAQSRCYTLPANHANPAPCYCCSSNGCCSPGGEIPALSRSFCANRGIKARSWESCTRAVPHTRARTANSSGDSSEERKPAVPALSPKPPILSAHTLLGRARGCFGLSRRSGLLVTGVKVRRSSFLRKARPARGVAVPKGWSR